MPDADKVHAGLPHRYQKTYQQLCERYIPAEALEKADLTRKEQGK